MCNTQQITLDQEGGKENHPTRVQELENKVIEIGTGSQEVGYRRTTEPPCGPTDRRPSQPAPSATAVAAGATRASCGHRRWRRSRLTQPPNGAVAAVRAFGRHRRTSLRMGA